MRLEINQILLGALALVISACAVSVPTPAGISAVSQATPIPEDSWYEGRTWAGEIDICVAATNDAAGCQWLAGLLIHSRCELRVYQTFAAALSVGGSFEELQESAIEDGYCDPVEGPESISKLKPSGIVSPAPLGI